MKLVLVGGGGHAGAVADVARSAGFDVIGVLTPDGSPPAPGLNRLGNDSWIDGAEGDVAFHIAIGPKPGADPASLFARLRARSLRLPPLVASSAIVSPSARIGEGSVIMHAAILNSRATVGNNTIINTRALVEHDCIVGDHTHLGPGTLLSGGVRIGTGCILGTGSIALPGVSVADKVTVGAGAVVVRAIEEPGGTWSGNPARRHV